MATEKGPEPKGDGGEDKNFFAKIADRLKGGDSAPAADSKPPEEAADGRAPLSDLSLEEADAVFKKSGGAKEEFERLQELRERDPGAYREQAARHTQAMDTHERGAESGAEKSEQATAAVARLDAEARARVEAAASPEMRKNFDGFFKNVGSFFKNEVLNKEQLAKTLVTAAGVAAMFAIPGAGALMGPAALYAALGSRGGELLTRAVLYLNPRGKENSARVQLEQSKAQLEATSKESAEIRRTLARLPAGPEREQAFTELTTLLRQKELDSQRMIDAIQRHEKDAATLQRTNRNIASRVGFVAGLVAGGAASWQTLHHGVTLNIDQIGPSHFTQWGADGINWYAAGGEIAKNGPHAFNAVGLGDIARRAIGATMIAAVPSFLKLGNKHIARAGVTADTYKGVTAAPASAISSEDRIAAWEGMSAPAKTVIAEAEKSAEPSAGKIVDEAPERPGEKLEEGEEKKEETKEKPQKLGDLAIDSFGTSAEGRIAVARALQMKDPEIIAGKQSVFLEALKAWGATAPREQRAELDSFFSKNVKLLNDMKTDGESTIHRSAVKELRALFAEALAEPATETAEKGKHFPSALDIMNAKTSIDGRKLITAALGLPAADADHQPDFIEAVKRWAATADDRERTAFQLFLNDAEVAKALHAQKGGESSLHRSGIKELRDAIAAHETQDH